MCDEISIKKIKAALEYANLAKVTEGTGISYPTLARIKSGDVSGCKLATLQKLKDFLSV